tara:strand:+ start:277 stop:894 length:618 start_codon:yes stop_codon:yes gene_type:complete
MVSKIDICNQGLVLIGANTIASFTDNTVESKVANQLYETTLRSLLTKARWRFATKQAQLTKLSTNPLDKWDSAYQIPNDAILIHTVTVSDNVIVFDRYNEELYTNTSSSDVVVCHYTFQPHEKEFPDYFTQAVVFELASLFAGAIARNDQLSMLYQKRGQQQLVLARSMESQTQTTRKLNTSLLIEVRNRGTADGIRAVVPSSSN